MKQYDSYKASGIDWIKIIPDHWNSIPIKYSVKSPQDSFVDGDWIESNVITSDGIRYLTTGNVGVAKYKEQGFGFISEETFKLLNCKEVFPGDLLISRLNEPIGRTCIVPNLGYRIVVAVDNVIYRPDESLYDKRYIMYQMNCKPYADNANFIARGSTMSRISRTTLGQIRIVVPPLCEQQMIASYLDKESEKIDKAIATQQKRIDLLRELRQNIITDAVTRGIDPNAPVKDSGVEWIGEIPKHWKIKKIKFLTKGYKAGPFGSSLITSNLLDEGDILVYTPEHIANKTSSLSGNLYLPENRREEMKQFLVQSGDILFPIVGTLGRAMLITNDMPCGIINQRLAKFTILKEELLTEFFLWLFADSSFYSHYINLYQRGSIIVNLTKEIVGNMPVPLPPLDEQKRIVDYIVEQTEKIDKSINKADHKILLLQELKQSIITEVVTGKRKVV